MNSPTTEDQLKQQGWSRRSSVFDPTHTKRYFKFFKVESGTLQLCVSIFDHPSTSSWEIGFNSRGTEGTWAEFKFHSQKLEDLAEQLEPLSERLILAWSAVLG
jgi:hypothetical protein